MDIIESLITWTPVLAEGFVWNIVVSLTAMVIGTPLGLMLAWGRDAAPDRGMARGSVRRACVGLTSLTRNVPTFAFLFYMALVIPRDFEIAGELYSVPAWLVASIGLGLGVAAFCSDNGLIALRRLQDRDMTKALLFLPSWSGFFVIILMASATSSAIGVPEIVSKANAVITATGDQGLMVWIYLYAMGWFLAFALVVNALVAGLRHLLHARTTRQDPVLVE